MKRNIKSVSRWLVNYPETRLCMEGLYMFCHKATSYIERVSYIATPYAKKYNKLELIKPILHRVSPSKPGTSIKTQGNFLKYLSFKCTVILSKYTPVGEHNLLFVRASNTRSHIDNIIATKSFIQITPKKYPGNLNPSCYIQNASYYLQLP